MIKPFVYSILNKEPLHLKKYNIQELSDFQQIINKALAKEVDHRYQSIADLEKDLQLCKEGLSARNNTGAENKGTKSLF